MVFPTTYQHCIAKMFFKFYSSRMYSKKFKSQSRFSVPIKNMKNKNANVENSLETKKTFDEIVNSLEETKKTIMDPSQKIISQKLLNMMKSLTSSKKIKYSTSIWKEKAPIVDTSSFSSPYTHLFKLKNYQYNPVESVPANKFITGLEKKKLKHLFLYQTCLNLEVPFKQELPHGATEENFLTVLKDWEEKLFRNFAKRKSIYFFMLKWSIKNKTYREKLAKQLETPTLVKNYTNPYNNKLIPLFNKTLCSKWTSNKHFLSNHFNQPLIFDMRFHQDIDAISSSLINQLNLAIALNHSTNNPFRIIFCNVNKNSAFFELWSKKLSPYFFQSVLITNRSLKDLEPIVQSEDLIYLSPNGAKEMTQFSHHKTYVIGGLIDRPIQLMRTRTICQSEKIYSERLPLKRYLTWGGVAGKMELTVNNVFEILFTLKQTDCWIKSLKCIPYRLHSGLTDMGKELANYDPKIIADFNKGMEWRIKKEKFSRGISIPLGAKTTLNAAKLYLGRS